VYGSGLIHLAENTHRRCHVARHHPCHLPQKVNIGSVQRSCRPGESQTNFLF